MSATTTMSPITMTTATHSSSSTCLHQTCKLSRNKSSGPEKTQSVSARSGVNHRRQPSQIHNVVFHRTTASASPRNNTVFTPESPENRMGQRALKLFAQASQDANLAQPEAEEISIPAKLQEMVLDFQAHEDQRARYQHLLQYAYEMDPLPPDQCVPENRMKGCALQVWVACRLGENRRVYFQADSRSLLMKGLAAVLVEGLSGATPREVMNVPAEFVHRLGLQQSLTPSRSNGFLNLLKLMQKKTAEVCGESGEKIS